MHTAVATALVLVRFIPFDGAVLVVSTPACAGADLYALCADAWMVAMKRRLTQAEAEAQASGAGSGAGAKEDSKQEAGAEGAEGAEGEAGVQVCAADFDTALNNLVPSLSLEEVAKYERLRAHYEGQKGGKR